VAAPPFYSRESLNVEVYDSRTDLAGTPVEGDIDFYVALARETGGPVLELACGTGRVTFPLARAGLEVVGVDRSAPMLARAMAKLLPGDRVTLVEGDMAEFRLGREFPLALIPFRAFQCLLTVEDQRRCLESVVRHLKRGGTFVVDLFDPKLELCAPDATGPSVRPGGTHPRSGNRVACTVGSRVNDPIRQVLTEVWRLTETDAGGRVVREEDEALSLRWTYRWEMRHLLERHGFEVVAEYSDFRRSPPAYGREQVWVARRP
jgi:ubiquinone/menaquinone biosynthesis C-methylase UbiE